MNRTLSRLVPIPAVVLALACIASLSTVAGAHGQTGIRFAIRPANGSPDAAANGSYFSYSLNPGRSTADAAVVTNSGQESVTLAVYTADGVTASGGGTAFGGRDEQRTGVRTWVSLQGRELRLAAGAAETIAFTVSVPAGTLPGDYVAGLIVEAPPRAGAGTGSIATSITERAGVAIVVRVPGPTTEKLAVGGICLNRETGSNYFEVPVRNEGTVLSRATGTFTLETANREHVFERAFELGSVIPALDTVIRVHSPQDPPPGKYIARVVLTQVSGQRLEREFGLTVPNTKTNGCEAVRAAGRPSGDQGQNDNFGARAVRESGDNPWVLPALVVAIGALGAALGFGLAWVNRGRAGRGPQPPPV